MLLAGPPGQLGPRLPGLRRVSPSAPPSRHAVPRSPRLPAPTAAHPQLFCALLRRADAVCLAAAAQLRTGGAHRPSLGAAEPLQSLAVLRAERPGLRSRSRSRALRGHGRVTARRHAHHLSQVAAGRGLPDPAPGPPLAAPVLPPAQFSLLLGRPPLTLDGTLAQIPLASAVF